MYKILVIDDEPDMTKSIRLAITLQEPEWTVIESHNPVKGLNLIDVEKPDLVLLDLRMPEMSGFEVLTKLRRYSSVPVIVVSVDDDELDEVNALEEGADDYIQKPFGHLDLLAHIRSVLRRANGYQLQNKGTFTMGTIVVDYDTNTIVDSRGGKIFLTSTEASILKILSDNAGQVVTSEILLGKVWGSNYLDNREYLKVYMRKLRLKIEENPSRPKFLITVKGVGYKLEP